MKLSAVEWLFLQSTDKKLDIFDLLEAKAMEKKQSKNDYEKGQESMQFKFPLTSDNYYEEAYKGGQDES
jgi:hypothetical protein